MIYSLGEFTPDIHPTAWVAPQAVVLGRVRLGAEASVWYGAVLRGDLEAIEIGESSNIQDLCVVHTDHGQVCRVGAGVTVGHRAILHSAWVEDGCLVGMGAILLGGCHIGEESLVAAGSLVPQGKTYPPRSLIMGSPAKVIRSLTTDEIEHIRANARDYVRLASLARSAKEVP